MFRLVIGLAARDCLHDRRLFVCFAAAFAAVLAPLLVVYGLKFGIIDHLIGGLTEDPRNREVLGVVNRNFDQAWFARMAARPDVAFIIPRTRTLAATAFLDRPGPATGRSVIAELIPTAAGDPLLGAPAALVDTHKIVVSQSAARRLSVAAGDPLVFWVVRDTSSGRERVEVEVTVAAVAPSSIFQRDGAYVSLALLTAVEDWRDGRAVPAFGWEGAASPEQRIYAGYRLFARSIFDVAGLEADLQREGLEVRTRAAEIESIAALDRNLSLIFLVVAGIALAGYTLSLGASLWANVERKRREISVIRLIGVPRGAARAFPVIQALLIASAGLVGAIVVYAAAAIALNTLYSGDYVEGAEICRLTGVHLAIATVGSLTIGVVASAIAAARVVRIEPSEGLRDE
jgi:putative ABC transport system permease protein